MRVFEARTGLEVAVCLLLQWLWVEGSWRGWVAWTGLSDLVRLLLSINVGID